MSPTIQGNPVFSSLPTTIFEVMSGLAREMGAVNLGQGFPDDVGPEDVRAKAADVALNGWNQYPPMMGLASLRITSIGKGCRWIPIARSW